MKKLILKYIEIVELNKKMKKKLKIHPENAIKLKAKIYKSIIYDGDLGGC